MLDNSMTRRSLLAAVIIAILPLQPSIAQTQQVVDIVNGEPITELDIERRGRLKQVGKRNRPRARR